MSSAHNSEDVRVLIAPRIPAGSEPGLVVDCPRHTLPFGIIFEEYAARRPDELRQHVKVVLNVESWDELGRQLTAQNKRYHELERLKSIPTTSPEEIQRLLREIAVFDRKLKQVLHRMNGSALCLSGGGIRSASFSLGVLEALSSFSLGLLDSKQKIVSDATVRHPGLMHQLDYLSTVSGGGYIGSWLTAWIYRRRRTEARGVATNGWGESYAFILRLLGGEGSLTSGDPEPQPTRHLRDYTAYLAPAMGLSLDSWDLFAIEFRNLLVNWIMLVPLLIALVSLPQISHFAAGNFSRIGRSWAFWAAIATTVVLFLEAACFTAASLPSHRPKKLNPGPGPGTVLKRFVLPVLLGNWIIAQLCRNICPGKYLPMFLSVLLISWLGFARLGAGVCHSYQNAVSTGRTAAHRESHRLKDILATQSAALISALATAGLLAWVVDRVFPHLTHCPPGSESIALQDRLFTIFAPPLVTMIPLLTVSLFSGLVGVFEQEEDREWLSRAGGAQLAVVVGWVLAHSVTLYATESWALVVAGLGGMVGGLASSLGFSSITSAGPRPVKAAQLSTLGRFLAKHNLVLPAASAGALLLIAFGVAEVEFKIAGGKTADLVSHLTVFGVSAALTLLLNWAININLFSLHGMYRERLMRAFLGASNTQRTPDAFTKFDPRDTPLETDLATSPAVPLHVHNATLNLVGTQDSAWRQRKAAPFSFTALHSGSWRLGYVSTDSYAHHNGPTVATVMAISGAAFNPNMGYHSSPLVTLLMTFFNARLGVWLPNPARANRPDLPGGAIGADFLRKSGPTMALEPLIREALGMTDENYRWIELSDGGHFEDLALYEMVLRRCHHIVVVDAGADPDCQFEDLGNALRKIEIDLGVPIRFRHGLHMKKGVKSDNLYCAVATINYGQIDGGPELTSEERAHLQGTLVYVKASLNGTEPPDIKQYALTHPTFPHETTASQFFNESQFESYRHLASHAIETIIGVGIRNIPPLAAHTPTSFAGAPCKVAEGVDIESFTSAAVAYSTGQIDLKTTVRADETQFAETCVSSG